MGEILNSEIVGDKILYTVSLDEKESIALNGGLKNIHMFSLDLCKTRSKIIERGKDGRTKYFLLPTHYKSKSKNKPKIKSIQRIDTKKEVIFVYICGKKIQE